MSNVKKAAIEYAIERVPESAKFKEQIIVGNHLREEIHDSFIRGYEQCQTEYEEKLRWIPIYEPPKTAELVIVDSGENLHACVAVAFFENGVWKYANGQKLWFAPRRWRSFL